VHAWSRETGVPLGAVVDPQTLWLLALRWYDDRLEHEWRRKTLTERQTILESVGLNGPFWSLT
jgi:hypothetical protein